MHVYPFDEGDGKVEWAVEFPDLPGCIAAGGTVEEAIVMAEDAKLAWIDAALDKGENLPAPSNPEVED